MEQEKMNAGIADNSGQTQQPQTAFEGADTTV
jgi:hypothetical protein